MRLVQRQREIPEWKKKEVEKLAELLKKYPVVMLSDIAETPTNVLQKIKVRLKEELGEHVEIKVTKNRLFKLAAEKIGFKGLEKLEPLLTGQRLFIFTDINPFTMALILSKMRIPAPAKPGMKVDREIIIPAGDTGLKPGPVLSSFGKLRIPTRVQGGTIWITKDTRVAKPGDIISEDLASMLQRLGIYPVKLGIKPLAAVDRGVFIPGEEMEKLNIDEYAGMLAKAHADALAVASEIALPVPEVLKISIIKAHTRALGVAAEAGFVTPETADIVIRKAVAKAYALIAAMGDKAKELGLEEIQQAMTAPAAAPAQPAEEKKEEEKEEEEEEKKELSEEELASGLEALFG